VIINLTFLSGPNHKNGAHGEHIADLGMDHVVEFRNLMIGICDYREIEFRALSFLDVLGQRLCESVGSTLRPITFTPRFSKSGLQRAT
jgi:hypothetical protein